MPLSVAETPKSAGRGHQGILDSTWSKALRTLSFSNTCIVTFYDFDCYDAYDCKSDSECSDNGGYDCDNFMFLIFRVKDGFNKVSAAVQAKLLDAAKFATTTADELRTVSQDVLSSLVSSSFMVVVVCTVKALSIWDPQDIVSSSR